MISTTNLCSSPLSCVSSSTSGAGSGPIFLTALNCLGMEQTLLECNTSNHPHSYSHGSDAGVQCAHRQYSGEIFAVIIVLMNRCMCFLVSSVACSISYFSIYSVMILTVRGLLHLSASTHFID